MTELKVCLFTAKVVHDFQVNVESIRYRIGAEDEFTFEICKKCFQKLQREKPNIPRYIIHSLLLDGKLESMKTRKIHWDSDIDEMAKFDLKKELDSAIYPTTPKEKIDYLFSKLYTLQPYDGGGFGIDLKAGDHIYFQNPDEYIFYVRSLANQGFINILSENKDTMDLNFTFEGLSKYIMLFEEGFNSNICFIAMHFDDKTIPIREAIKSAVSKAGFKHLLIDEEHIPTDGTINDAIIAGLRKCKFCIADFCGHRQGVYFEAGFALGQGKPVFFTCNESEFKQAHFDIKPLQHLVYKTAEELEQRLIAKIEAWIK